MKFLSLATFITTALSGISGAEAYWKGFNVGANNPDGSCKSQADWKTAFNTLKGLPGHFTSVRLYASSDCNTLENAVPAALATGMQILVGVWTEDDTHFNNEKQALLTAIQQHGSGWIIAVSVGSEDLYRGNTNPAKLASQINDVRGMIRSVGANQEVGHGELTISYLHICNSAIAFCSGVACSLPLLWLWLRHSRAGHISSAASLFCLEGFHVYVLFSTLLTGLCLLITSYTYSRYLDSLVSTISLRWTSRTNIAVGSTRQTMPSSKPVTLLEWMGIRIFKVQQFKMVQVSFGSPFRLLEMLWIPSSQEPGFGLLKRDGQSAGLTLVRGFPQSRMLRPTGPMWPAQRLNRPTLFGKMLLCTLRGR